MSRRKSSRLLDLSFRFIKPQAFLLPESLRKIINLFIKPNLQLEILNTRLPYKNQAIINNLKKIANVPRMSSFAIAAIINHAVSQLPSGQAYLNIGVWNGFTFLAGLVGNPQKICIGVDNFSEFAGPAKDFIRRFQKYKSPRHHFYQLDYRAYFKKHRVPIGLYFYDGPHGYHHQLRGLQIAEPHFAPRCLIIIDDLNWPVVQQATADFLKQSSCQYRTLLRQQTAYNGHPTFWNGFMVLQKF